MSQELFTDLKQNNVQQLQSILESKNNLVWAFFHRLYKEGPDKKKLLPTSKEQDDFLDKIPDMVLRMFYRNKFVTFAKTAKNKQN
jgi:hypothetical protein